MSTHEWLELLSLIAWIVTAGGGFVLLAVWLSRGGMRQGRGIRPPLILSHFLLAATGLVLWIIYYATDSEGLGWVAFIALLIVAVLGWTMFAVWWRDRAGRAATPPPEPATPGAPTAEQHFPVPIVALHGLLAVTTVLLVLLTVLEVGE